MCTDDLADWRASKGEILGGILSEQGITRQDHRLLSARCLGGTHKRSTG